MKRRAVITGLGVVAPNGIGKEAFWRANLEARSGVAFVTSFDTAKFHTRIAAEVKDFEPSLFMPADVASRVDRFVHFGLASAGLALEDSGLALEKTDRERVGVIMGSGLGGMLFHEAQILATLDKGAHRVNPACVPRITPNAVAAHMAIQYGLLGPNYVVSTACASGNHAIGEAYNKIQDGRADIILAGGAEAPLTPYTFGAFYSLRVMSRSTRPPKEVSRPFDRERDGFVMGEGGAVLVLEEVEHALRRNAHIYAEVVGYGLTSGASHMVMPKAGGEDAARTLRLALQDAGLRPGEVDYINAHGTSTKANDTAETQAIKDVFGADAYRIPVSSTKSMIGHTIGAAGAIEAVASCLAIEEQILPPTINYEQLDPECDLDYVPGRPRPARVNTVLSNSFGFGSVNACIVFKKYA
ncbi:MAG: beta-ketoacyl-ACP synthase II [Thermodesulfobacteriota bacterium]